MHDPGMVVGDQQRSVRSDEDIHRTTMDGLARAPAADEVLNGGWLAGRRPPCRYGSRWTDSRKVRIFLTASSSRRSFQAGMPLSRRPRVMVVYAVSVISTP
jgi:hypothetical protein